MLVPRCLKETFSELLPFKVTGNYMGSMQQINFETQIWILTL